MKRQSVRSLGVLGWVWAGWVWVALTTGGCANPYVQGYSGERLTPLPAEVPVRVIGADEADAVAMRRFEAGQRSAAERGRLLGTATAVTDAVLRDAVAADAARQLGADTVLYRFGYLNATVETDVYESFERRRDDDGKKTRFTRRVIDRTRHWFVYRALFYASPAEPGLP
ncbi:MAG: hypothetical protein AAGI68_04005 [Planctomycetota bacterium]